MTFEPLVRDLIARTQSRVDLNGQPCAVIRVSAANVGDFVFEGNIIGEVMYSQGEALIYMPQGSRRLKIKNDEYGTVGYEFPEKLEKQMTYELRIDPLKKNPFSQEALAEAERVINRYWEVTGLKEIKDKNILPSFSMKNDVRISYEGDTLVYETQMMFDISSKKMFMQEYGQACGRNGDKYWAGLIGEEVRLTEKSEPFKRNKITRMLQLPLTKVKEVYEGMQKPFGLDMFDVENSSWVYTIGENKLENGKRYIGIYKRSKTTEFAVKVIYMDSETGLVYQIADYTDNSLTEFLEYQEIDGILLCKTVRQTRDGAEMLTQVKEVNLNILFDESLLKKKGDCEIFRYL